MGISVGNFSNAADMKSYTDDKVNSAVEIELEQLQLLMSESNSYYIRVPKLSSNAKQILEEKGYKVQYTNDQRDGTYYTISWK